jgi:HSP20 family molecular chaperone IbpA
MSQINNYPLFNPFGSSVPGNNFFSFPLLTDWNNFYFSEPIRIVLKEKKDAYAIEANVSGVKKDSLKVVVDNDTVIISGDFSNGNNNDVMRSEKVWANEIFTGHAEREIHLDHCISPTLSSAKLENGKLLLSLKKLQDTEPAELKIT